MGHLLKLKYAHSSVPRSTVKFSPNVDEIDYSVEIGKAIGIRIQMEMGMRSEPVAFCTL